MRRLLLIAMFVLTSTASVTLAQTKDECGCTGLLAGGVFNKYNFDQDETARLDMLNFVAYSTYDEFKKAASAGGSGDYLGSYGKFGFDANWGREEFEKRQKDLRTNNQLSEDTSIRRRLLQQYASDVIVNGYNECIKNCASIRGFRAWFDAKDQRNLTLTIYNGMSGGLPTIESFDIGDGGILSTTPPTILKARDNIFRITRVGNKPILVVVRTSAGDLEAYTPEFRKPLPTRPVVTPSPAPTPVPRKSALYHVRDTDLWGGYITGIASDALSDYRKRNANGWLGANISVSRGYIYMVRDGNLFGAKLEVPFQMENQGFKKINDNAWNGYITVFRGYLYFAKTGGELYVATINGLQLGDLRKIAFEEWDGQIVATAGRIYLVKDGNLYKATANGVQVGNPTLIQANGWDGSIAVGDGYLYLVRGDDLYGTIFDRTERIDLKLIKSGGWEGQICIPTN